MLPETDSHTSEPPLMPDTHEEAAARGRRTSEALLAALAEQKLVERFLERYVEAHGRRELRDSPIRHREALVTIHREALLAMAAAVQAALPQMLARRRSGLLSGAEAELAAVFQEEFLRSLGDCMGWGAAESEEFISDLELCRRLSGAAAAKPRARRGGDASRGPFVERCALLLDPSFLEQAQRAAVKFQEELLEATQEIVAVAWGGRKPALRRREKK